MKLKNRRKYTSDRNNKNRLLMFSCIVIALLCLSACGNSPEKTPTATVEEFLQAIQKDNISDTESVYADGTFDLGASAWTSDDEEEGLEDEDVEGDSDPVFKVLQDDFYPKVINFDYKVDDESINGKKATVKVSITTYKLGDAIYNGYMNFFDKEMNFYKTEPSDTKVSKRMAEYLHNSFDKASKKTYQKDITLKLSVKDDKWVIDKLSNDDVDALSGGMVSAQTKVNKYLDKLYEDMNN